MKKQTNLSDTIAFLLIAALLVAFVVLILPEPNKDKDTDSTETEVALEETDTDNEYTLDEVIEENDDGEVPSQEIEENDTDLEDDAPEATEASDDESSDEEDSGTSDTEQASSDDDEDLPETDPYFETEGDSFDDIMVQVLSALLSADFGSLSDYVGEEGLRLSPMGAFLEDDIILSSNEVSEFLSMDEQKFGVYRGSGNAIRMTPVEYYNKFICPSDFDFSQTSVYIDDDEDMEAAGWGDIHTVRYTYEPNVMEWQDVIMVYRESDGRDYLVGIIHRDVTTN